MNPQRGGFEAIQRMAQQKPTTRLHPAEVVIAWMVGGYLFAWLVGLPV